MKILVTGGTGFVGKAFAAFAARRGWRVRLALRGGAETLPDPACELAVVGPIDSRTVWEKALEGCDAVAHLGARVHVMDVSPSDVAAQQAFYETNALGTLRLARFAAAAGVARFLFLSTIKVNGEGREAPYTEADVPAPEDPYALSKWEAEKGLSADFLSGTMSVTVLRPPLVYGPCVRANFLQLMKMVACGVPLPLAAVKNRRSLIYLGNLVSAMGACLTHEGARNRTFVVSDGQDVSTPDLIAKIASALGREDRTWPMPPSVLRLGSRLLGKGEAMDRLLTSLCIDSALIRSDLGWAPPFTLDDGLRETAAWFRLNNDGAGQSFAARR